MRDVLARLQERHEQSPLDTVFTAAIDEIKHLRSLCDRGGQVVECPPVPKTIDPTGW